MFLFISNWKTRLWFSRNVPKCFSEVQWDKIGILIHEVIFQFWIKEENYIYFYIISYYIIQFCPLRNYFIFCILYEWYFVRYVWRFMTHILRPRSLALIPGTSPIVLYTEDEFCSGPSGIRMRYFPHWEFV